MTELDRWLHHVTLASGDIRLSPRSEVGDDVVRLLRPLLPRALTGEHVAVPGQPGYTMTGGVHGRCCAVTLWMPDPIEGPRPERVPLLTTFVAPHSRCGAYLWREAHSRDDLVYATDPARVPPEPWCADRLDIGGAMFPPALEWTGDWSRCVAWGWIECLHDRRRRS